MSDKNSPPVHADTNLGNDEIESGTDAIKVQLLDESTIYYGNLDLELTSKETPQMSKEALVSHNDSYLLDDTETDNDSHPHLFLKKPSSGFHKFLDYLKSHWFVLSSIGLALVLLFLSGSFFYFKSHALPNSFLGNQNISFWSRQKINNFAEEQAKNYSISILDNGENKPVNLETQLGIKITPIETSNNIIRSQNASPYNNYKFWQKRKYTFENSIDLTKLKYFVDSQKNTIKTLGQNAVISIKDGDVIIIPGINQDEITIKNPESKIYESINNAEPLILELEQLQTPPNITTAKLEPLRDYIQTIIDTDIDLKLNDIIINTTKEQRASWLTIDSASTDEAAVDLDRIKIEAYVDGAIQPYIMPPRSRVVVVNKDGTNKELVSGEDGVSLTDKSSVISKIETALGSKQSSLIDISVSYSKRSTITAADYPKWIQADLTNKRLYAYEHGTLVKEYLLSAGAPETPTVTGEYKINYKIRKQTMRGLNADGSSYVQPDVEWVNYFYEDYAIHGNYWRPSSVFGNTNTSHGCVGLVNVDAEWVYNWAPVGTPVITHY